MIILFFYFFVSYLFTPYNGRKEDEKKEVAKLVFSQFFDFLKILTYILFRHNETLETKQSITWFTHQKCDDMHVLSKWNGTKTYRLVNSYLSTDLKFKLDRISTGGIFSLFQWIRDHW